jgi:transcriptional regulator with XRE-family HTH domain
MTRTLKLYRSYMFVTKDPCIDVLRGLVRDSGMSYTQVHDASGVTRQTIHNWFHGDTKRPQFATVAAVARGLGKSVRFGNVEVEDDQRPAVRAALAKQERKANGK